jgi:SAM-dependent methyltransferase
MSNQPFHLSGEQQADLLARYRGHAVERLSYGTVADFCDSSDHVPLLPHIQGDLKDLQRPATLKMILSLCPPGSALLEIGAGEPYVAQMLADLGYLVTVVDPYDGSGRGPTEFEYYRNRYPDIHIVRDVFSERTPLTVRRSFDCIYSISVLEHVHQPYLGRLFAGVKRFLGPGGKSLHLVDHVLAGNGADFHLLQLSEIISQQAAIAGRAPSSADLQVRLAAAGADIETFFLSPSGHNLWRGQTPYASFPFRKVMSIHTCETAPLLR